MYYNLGILLLSIHKHIFYSTISLFMIIIKSLTIKCTLNKSNTPLIRLTYSVAKIFKCVGSFDNQYLDLLFGNTKYLKILVQRTLPFTLRNY